VSAIDDQAFAERCGPQVCTKRRRWFRCLKDRHTEWIRPAQPRECPGLIRATDALLLNRTPEPLCETRATMNDVDTGDNQGSEPSDTGGD
jgi:hypothetical protein